MKSIYLGNGNFYITFQKLNAISVYKDIYIFSFLLKYSQQPNQSH